MKLVLIGDIFFTYIILKFLKKNKNEVFVISSRKKKLNSDSYNLKKFCKVSKIKFYETNDINDHKTFQNIRNFYPDLILCIGFSKLLRGRLLKSYKNKLLGYHPSNLPYNRGRHPIIWSVFLGLKFIYSSFFLIDKGIDSGKIISKEKFVNKKNYFADDVYKKLATLAIYQLSNILTHYKKYKKLKIIRQRFNKKSVSNLWRKRTFEDGKIDWRMSKETIINLVRSLSHPYPGAHFLYKKKVIKVFRIQKATFKKASPYLFEEPGKVVSIKNGISIKCADGYLKIKEILPKIKIKKGDYL